MDDHRASSGYRSAMLAPVSPQVLRPESRAAEPGDGDAVPTSFASLHDRPTDAKVGLELPHESADLHVTGAALYTDDLVVRNAGVLHAWPVQAPHGHALITELRPKPAYDVPGVVRVLTAEDVPGINDAGIKHDEPLFPSEVMFYGHAVCWVLAETLDAARQGAEAVEVDYEPQPALITLEEAIAAGSFQGHERTVSRGDVESGLADAVHRFRGEFEYGGQEHFYLETHASLAHVDENGQIFVQCSTQHPSETQEIVAHVLGLSQSPRDRPVPADGRRLRGQGDAAARLRRDRRPRCHDHRSAGPAAAQPHPGHDHVGQAAPVPLQLGGRLRRRDAHHRAAGHPGQRRWLESRPVRAGAGPRPVPHRQRLLDPQHRGRRQDRQDQQDLADGVPGLRRSAGHDRDRGHPRPLRTAAGSAGRRAAPPQSYRAGADHAVRSVGPARRAAARHLGVLKERGDYDRRAAEVAAYNAEPRTTPSAAWRSPRSSSASRST